jgi:glutathione synthase/RimK-type ligase-like ATP-grasp enzyme
MAFDGADLTPVWNSLVDRVNNDPHDAAALIDLSTIAHIAGRPGDRIALQNGALELQRVYRQPPTICAPDGIRLLAFMVPGNFLANTPLEFLLGGSNVTLDMVYVLPGKPLPQPLPDHDVALVAITELDENQVALRKIAALVASWPRPVVNAPDRIARLTRDGAWALLKSAPGIAMPVTVRVERSRLMQIASGDVKIEAILEGNAFPIIARPLDSHGGEGLAKLETSAAVDSYLDERPEKEFFASPFVDYSGSDGLFRKYRIALIEGRPYACHMAISQHWMIHYVNADMYNNAERRAEEAQFMANFDEFAIRHDTTLTAIAERIGLDYVTMDCAEMPDGRLLVFEVGNGMIVHAMDHPDLFPYKRPQMEKVFSAFQTMLRNAIKGSEPSERLRRHPASFEE